MRKKKLVARVAIVATLAMLLNSCAATPESCRVEQDTTGRGILIGAGVGAVAGGLGAALGHQRNGEAAAIVVGAALIGGLVGAIVSHEHDKACHALAMKQALDDAVAQNAILQQQREEAERKAAEEEAQRRAMNLQSNGTGADQSAPPRVTPVSTTPAAPPPTPKYMTVAWANQVSKNSGTITPLADVSEANAKDVCMTFSDSQTIDGQTKTVVGKACRGADGDWRPL